MRYCDESRKISISVREFVTISRRCVGSSSLSDEDEPFARQNRSQENTYALSHDFTLGEYNFALAGAAAKIEGDKIYTVYYVGKDPKKPTRAEKSQARGEAYTLGKMLCDKTGFKNVRLSICYVSQRLGESFEVSESVSSDKLTAFFSKCALGVKIYAKPEIERVTERLPSMQKLKFPYTSARNGQGDFVRAVYRNIARGGTLFACAPTGTGKTVSVIYPAIRALGDERVEKVFYLTPKGTTAQAAKDCLLLMEEHGAKIKGVIISSKERCCQSGLLCQESRSLCKSSKSNKLPDALLELYNEKKAVVDISDINRIAPKYQVCPYELELAYSELCDVIICDFNYLFDPVVYLKRFFSEGGKYAFLIDEAHNLPDRAREMYSAELDEKEMLSLLQNELISPLSKLREQICSLCQRWREILMPYLQSEIREDKERGKLGATHLSVIPSDMYSLISDLTDAFEEELAASFIAVDESKLQRIGIIRDFLYKIKKFNSAMEGFSSSYKLFLFYENGTIRAKLFCVDTGELIKNRLEVGHGAVFFSATLTPLNYYKSVLGGDRTSEEIEIRSPFDKSQLSVSIMDKISTRYSERDRTLPAVCRAIAAVLSAKRGNYMVFSPSFEYSDALAKAFIAKYPKITVLTQKRDMTKRDRDEFLAKFSEQNDNYLIGFCVMGGIYSEGIDLAGDSLIGAVVVGIGIPSLSYEREAMAEYYEDKYEAGKQFAYIYPGMNRVFQAAGRVIRRENDRGVIVLIDDRFDDPIYKKSIPELWRGMEYVSDAKALNKRISDFWQHVQEEFKD